jgi:hypothetical protein
MSIFNPTFTLPNGAKPVKTSLVPVTIKGKSTPGYQTTFSDGTSKWTSKRVTETTPLATLNNFDYSTFTGSKNPNEKWEWKETTDKSITNFSSETGLTQQQIKDGLYKTPTLQNALNGTRVQQLGGTQAAQKIDPSIPQSSGTSVNPNAPVDQGSIPSGEGGTTANDSTVNTGGGLLSGASIKTEGRSVKDYPENNLLRYPLDMSGKQDCITFTMLEYAPKKFSSSASDFARGEAQSKRAGFEGRRGKTVTLPIQPSISDTNAVKWGAEDMNAFQGIVAAAALSTIKDGVSEGGVAALTGGAKLIADQGGSLGALTATYFAGQAAQVQGLLTRATGGIINPNTELLFQGPDLRSFSFNFTLSAREPQEAIQIKNIIRFFKQGMSVKRADTGLFLKSPHTFEIKYLFNGNEHPWINKIKECALVSCNVNYTPAGNYATYEDGSMTQYDISLSFSELEPVYDDDYAEADKAIGGGLDSSIGY